MCVLSCAAPSKNPTRIASGYHAILEDYPDVEPFIVN